MTKICQLLADNRREMIPERSKLLSIESIFLRFSRTGINKIFLPTCEEIFLKQVLYDV